MPFSIGAGFSYWVAGTENSNNFQPAVADVTGANKYFRSGFGWGTTEITAQNSVYATLARVCAPVSGSDAQETFYVFPPASVAHGKNMILVVKGTFNDGANPPETKYFPVQFDGTDQQVLQSGKQYGLTITLSGDAGIDGGGGGGTTDPETKILPSYVTVTVSIGAWEAEILMSKEFN